MPVSQIIELPDFQLLPVFSFNKSADSNVFLKIGIAISPNDSKVHIYSKKGSNWSLETTLTEHSERVNGIDWSHSSNRLLTCGADRNAYVWKEDKPGEWKPSLVILRINRAAICAKWAPDDKKFAIGTGSKLLSVSYYVESNDWWVAKHIKKNIRSSILAVAWHPSSAVLAAASSDFYVRVYGAAIKNIDSDSCQTSWSSETSLGHVIAEFKNPGSGWIHAICFSPSGNRLVWTSHDSTLTVADTSKGQPTTCLLKLSILPFLACLFLNEDTIIAAGHENSPYKFTYNGNEITLVGDVDTGCGTKKNEPTKQSAMSKFRNLDTMAQVSSKSSESNKTHSNTLTKLVHLSGSKIASGGLDNKIVIWDNL